jgi:serine/threonine protein kinase
MQGKILLNRYRIIRALGEGGMGKVYLARQTDLNRDVVIKVMHEHVAQDPRFQTCFQQETQAMAAFQHPYAVALYDAQLVSSEGPCIIMEYVKGKTLDIVLRENKRLTPQRVSRILGQLCEVLYDAHQKGIVHRDLKPSNLMVMEADTQFEKIKVMDFGLAKLGNSPSIKQMSESGGEYMLGTPAYVSPEQARGEDVDHRTDIYSTGVVLYELLTGHLPFDGLSTMDTLLAHAIEPPPPMSNEEIWIPPRIEQVIMKCLAKRPEERFNSARELHKCYMDALAASDPTPAQVAVPVQQAASAPAGYGPAAYSHPFAPMPAAPGYGSGTFQAPTTGQEQHLDPGIVNYQLQAWMPQSVASYKLTGFIDDVRGEVIESQPGRIRVLFGAKGTPYAAPSSGWNFFASGKPDIELEMQLYESTDPKTRNLVWISVQLKYIGKKLQPEWRERAEAIYRDLRGYLIGASESLS